MLVIDEEGIAEKARTEGLLSPDQIDACRELRRRVARRGLVPPGIGEIALGRGWLKEEQVTSLYGLSRKTHRPRPKGPARTSFRARLADLERKKTRRRAALYVFLAVLAAAVAVFIEWKLR
jgi:hypothetical protein